MQTKRPRICVVGSANMDLLTKVPRLPRLGETLVGHYFHMGCGGKGSNQAVMSAKLQADVTMVVKLGNDPFGEITLKNYQSHNIDTQFVFWDDDHFSGVAPIFVDDHGKNVIVIVPGANMTLSPKDVQKASNAIQSADVVVCQLEISVETTLEALRIAKQANVRTILNPAPATPIPDEMFLLSDVIAPNETETEILTGLPVKTIDQVKAAARALQSRGSKNVILTLGERGAYVLGKSESCFVPATHVEAIDTTGAGDAFIGSFAYFWGAGDTIKAAVQKANIIAGISVTKIGTQVSFPSWEEVKELI